MHVKNHMQIIK